MNAARTSYIPTSQHSTLLPETLSTKALPNLCRVCILLRAWSTNGKRATSIGMSQAADWKLQLGPSASLGHLVPYGTCLLTHTRSTVESRSDVLAIVVICLNRVGANHADGRIHTSYLLVLPGVNRNIIWTRHSNATVGQCSPWQLCPGYYHATLVCGIDIAVVARNTAHSH